MNLRERMLKMLQQDVRGTRGMRRKSSFNDDWYEMVNIVRDCMQQIGMDSEANTLYKGYEDDLELLYNKLSDEGIEVNQEIREKVISQLETTKQIALMGMLGTVASTLVWYGVKP